MIKHETHILFLFFLEIYAESLKHIYYLNILHSLVIGNVAWGPKKGWQERMG